MAYNIDLNKVIEHPETVYSRDFSNNCIIIKWGESGYYRTDYPAGRYTDDIVDELNQRRGITPAQRYAMECCSIAAQTNPSLDWNEHYKMCLESELNKADNEPIIVPDNGRK